MESFVILAQAVGQVILNFSPVIPIFIAWVYVTRE